MGAGLATIADLPEEFCKVAPGAAQQALDLMAPLVGVTGPCAAIACELHAALTAHWLSLSRSTAGTGGGMAVPYSRVIDKIQAGGVSVQSFLLPYSLNRTKWGALYLALCATCAGPGVMVV